MAEESRGMSRIWILTAAVLVTGSGCTPMDDALVAIFGRSMRDQPSIGTYEDPRLPPEGAVSFASGNFPAAEGEIGLGQAEGVAIPEPVTPLQVLQGVPAVNGLENPVEPTPESLARGEEMFLRSCSPCHGAGGQGDGTVTQAGMPSYTLVEGPALEHSDGYIYSIIRVGRGTMPAYGHQVTHFDRWHIVNYVRQLQGQSAEPPSSADPEASGETDGEG